MRGQGEGQLCQTFREELLDGRAKRRQALLDYAPDDAVIDCAVSMNEDVSESDDLVELRNPGCDLRRSLAKAVQCLSDDLELPLHGSAEHGGRRVVVERLTFGERDQEFGGLTDVLEVGASFRLHRG